MGRDARWEGRPRPGSGLPRPLPGEAAPPQAAWVQGIRGHSTASQQSLERMLRRRRRTPGPMPWTPCEASTSGPREARRGKVGVCARMPRAPDLCFVESQNRVFYVYEQANILGSFGDHLGIILGPFWNHFRIILGYVLGYFGIILDPFWDHLRII